jgi:hypothetical protein
MFTAGLRDLSWLHFKMSLVHWSNSQEVGGANTEPLGKTRKLPALPGTALGTVTTGLLGIRYDRSQSLSVKNGWLALRSYTEAW